MPSLQLERMTSLKGMSEMDLAADKPLPRASRVFRMGPVRMGPVARLVRMASIFLATLVPLAAQEEKDPALDLYFVANGAYNRKLYPAAIGGFEEFLKKHGNHPKADLARRGLALSLYAQKQYEKAIPHLTELLNKQSLPDEISRDRLTMMQGNCLLRSGRQDEARSFFVAEVGRLQDPAFKTTARAAIADICFAKQEWEEVCKWTAQLLSGEVSPDQAARGHYQQGFAFYQLKKHTEAIAALEKVAPLEGDGAWKTRAAYLLGECFTILQEHAKAEPAFEEALRGLQGADLAECHRRLGVARFLLEKWEASAAELANYLKLEGETRGADQKEPPQVPEARLFIGRCLLEQGNAREAEKRLGSLANGEGEIAARASLWLARVHSRAGTPNYDRAAQILEEAVQKHAKSGVIDDLRFDFANALMSRPNPDWKMAADQFGRINPGDFGQYGEVLAQWATCLHKIKDYNQSLRIADRFLEKFKEHPMAADTMFLRAENLFLLDQLDAAATAYQEFIAGHGDHANALASALRTAQVHHQKGNFAEALKVAQPLLAKKPEGPLFAQLAFLVGDSQFRLEKWQEAVPPLEDFIATRVDKKNRNSQRVSTDPNVDTALMQLAVSYTHLGQVDKALEHLETLTRFYPQPTPHLALALAEQGRLAYESGDLKLAKQSLERFLSEDSKDEPQFKKNAGIQRPRVHYYLGWVNSVAGNHEEAATCFEQVISVKADHDLAPDAALQQGIAYVNAENFEAAAKHFPEMLKKYPDHERLPRITYFAGLSLARIKDWGRASGYLRKVVESYGDSEFAPQALYEWAWCERAQERKQQAVELYERLIENYGDSDLAIKVQSELAELNLDSGAQDAVIERLSKTLEEVTDPVLKEDILYQLASAYFKKGDYGEAATRFEELLEEYPSSTRRASMCFQAGEARLRLEETVAAREHFAAGLKAEGIPGLLRESMTMRLGEMQTATSQFEESHKTYIDFLNRFGESQWRRNAQFGIGWALENLDSPQEAIREYAKLLQDGDEVDLWTVRARYQTGECLFNMQQYEKAITEFLHCELNYTKYPSWQAKAMLEIGRVLLAQEKNEEAMERFKEVIKRYPNEKAALVARQYLDQLRGQ